MATLKHINSKNADYGAAEQYLLFEHDEFTMKPVLDETGRLMPVQLPVSVTRFIVQHRITKLLKSTLFVKLPAIRFHILTSFLVGKLVVLPPFRGAIRRF